MMFAKDEPIALKIVGGVFEVERLACCRVLGRSHLVLSPAQPFGRARLSHEGEGLRDDEREILAEQSVHLTGTGERVIFPDADNAQPAARIMAAYHARPPPEAHPLPVITAARRIGKEG